ncbi:hypothetical protein PHYSODRAFT_518181, partial [Phytophthora sojae]
GKFKRKTIEEVFVSDPGYCRWHKNQPNLLNDTMLKFLESKLTDDYVMNFGKYKNRKLKTVHALDPNYTNWLRKNEFVFEKCPRLVKELRELH